MAQTLVSGVQYSGSWSLSSVANARALGTWPTQLFTRLYGWGENTNGQLGLNNITNYSSPKQIGTTTDWVTLGSGPSDTYFSMAIKADGTLWAWGINDYGQLGLGTVTKYSSPKQVGALTTWSKVTMGYQFSVALKTDGTLWSWGRNDVFGSLGIGNRVNYSSPKQIGSLTDWLSISAGYYSVVAVKTDGTLWSWGANSKGQLGLGNRTLYSSPKQVGSLTDWLQASASGYFCHMVKTDGTLWTWGENAYGQLGLGTITYMSSPNQVGSLTTWSKAVGGTGHALATKTDGTLWSWGANGSGQLGIGNQTSYNSPKQVGLLTNWSIPAGSFYQSAVIKTDGTLWVWGSNSSGQIGIGNTTAYSSPKQVGSLTGWTAISLGNRSALALLAS